MASDAPAVPNSCALVPISFIGSWAPHRMQVLRTSDCNRDCARPAAAPLVQGRASTGRDGDQREEPVRAAAVRSPGSLLIEVSSSLEGELLGASDGALEVQ